MSIFLLLNLVRLELRSVSESIQASAHKKFRVWTWRLATTTELKFGKLSNDNVLQANNSSNSSDWFIENYLLNQKENIELKTKFFIFL